MRSTLVALVVAGLFCAAPGFSWAGGGCGDCDEEGGCAPDNCPGGSGSTGATGAIGATGVAGPSGASGPSGPPGLNGASGPSGGAGPAGLTGASGPSGPAGSSGPSGPTGPTGTEGVACWDLDESGICDGAEDVDGGGCSASDCAGASGQSGPSGPSGTSGASGPSGPAGPSGPSGPAGANGANGGSGPSGAAGPAGATGATGTAGPSGPSGPGGPAGPSGATGPGGGAGTTGANYIYSYDSTTQTVATPGTFQVVTFNTNGPLNGWTHPPGTADFTASTTGVYLVDYSARIVKGGASGIASIRAVLNAAEIPGSQASASSSSGDPGTVARSFLVSVAAGDVLRIHFTSDLSGMAIAPAGLGTPGTGIALTIIRIQ